MPDQWINQEGWEWYVLFPASFLLPGRVTSGDFFIRLRLHVRCNYNANNYIAAAAKQKVIYISILFRFLNVNIAVINSNQRQALQDFP